MGKVLITEKVHPVGPQLLRAAGHQVVQVETAIWHRLRVRSSMRMP